MLGGERRGISGTQPRAAVSGVVGQQSSRGGVGGFRRAKKHDYMKMIAEMKFAGQKEQDARSGYSYGISGMGGYEENIEEMETSLFGADVRYDPEGWVLFLIAIAIGKETIDLM